MKTRRILAVLLLVTMPLFALSFGVVKHRAMASTHQGVEMYALGVDGGWALVFGIGAAVTCAAFVGPAAVGCGVAAAG